MIKPSRDLPENRRPSGALVIALSHQIIDFARRGSHGSPNRNTESEPLWSLVGRLFNAGIVR